LDKVIIHNIVHRMFVQELMFQMSAITIDMEK